MIGGENGASEGIRTLDIHVGNVTLYQTELRSLPFKQRKIKINRSDCKPRFPARCARMRAVTTLRRDTQRKTGQTLIGLKTVNSQVEWIDMNTKDLIRLGVPPGEPTRRAMDYISR